MALVKQSHEKCDGLLINWKIISIMLNKNLIVAAANGNADEVRRLIPLSDSLADKTQALQYAVQNGHFECVKLLIPVSNPKDNNSSALSRAAYYGDLAIIKLLLPHSNPKANNSQALCIAVLQGHDMCVGILHSVSDPKKALEYLKTTHPDKNHIWGGLEQAVLAQHNQKRLTRLLKKCVSEHTGRAQSSTRKM